MKDLENAEDVKILQDFQQGQAGALDFLLSKYKNLVVSLARRYFLLGAEQEDLIQEGMIGLYKACQSFDAQSGSSFKSFAYLCIKRQLQSAIKAANRQKNVALNTALSFSSKNGVVFINAENAAEGEKMIYLPSFQQSPEQEMLHQEAYDEMIENIKKSLSPFEYTILNYYLDGFKCGQIADLTNNTYKAIDNALYRIKNKLQFLNNKK